jgi:carbonic anhydrase
MPDNVCVCRYCADPRENGFHEQHGLPALNGLFMTRSKGAFVSKPSPTNDISNTCVMLLKVNREPMSVMQGHRDCAAVRLFFTADKKDAAALDNTDREFLRSCGEALKAVKQFAAALKTEEQLRILERICVLQGINNLFSFDEISKREGYQPFFYAYYSLSRPAHEPQPVRASDIGLMIFDPEEGVFARAPHGNDGIRITDLIDPKTFRPRAPGRFEITRPIDLEMVARNEARYALAGIVPQIEDIREDTGGERFWHTNR